MNQTTQRKELKPLLFALLVGFCGNATAATLFNSHVTFSLFPVIALVLSVYCLYQRYVSAPLQNDSPLLTGLSFIFGVLAYSVFVRVEHPEIGSNFIPLMLCMALLFWILSKLGLLSKKRT
ncbi:MAG: YijD family membrane protein [Plesiomonas sp.]|uniref:YijD family membrane protein n=1 Tax=Plesiomonas sp. TaxID=2486279 RepID=UPI003F3D1618